MTATDELRRLLDERGVEWSPSAWDRSTETYWKTADGNGCLAIQGETKLRLSFADYFTPEQAVEATLGRGECHDKNGRNRLIGFECTVCGVMCSDCDMLDLGDGFVHFRYCPSCGRKVRE